MPISSASAATVLTCDNFKARLDESIKAMGASTPTPTGFALIRDAGRSGRSYAWTSEQGLSGRLTCAPGDAFADFYMMRETTPAAIEHLDGFRDLGAASICALASAGPDACRGLVDTMTEDGLDEYEESIAKHKARAQGLQDYDIAAGLDAVFNITPQLISWAIGPGVFKTTEAERPTFEPHDHDDDVE